MRLLPMSFVFNRKLQPQTFNSSNSEMLASNPYSLELPYLGTIFLGKSPPNLMSFQKPLREMYLSYNHEYSHEQRRILISDSDILIFESENVQRSKRSFTYAKLESIVNIQILKFSLMRSHNPKHHLQVAFLPLGCEHQERFHSLYSAVNKSQAKLLSNQPISHPSLLLFILRKPGVTGSCSLLDCHVFVVHREAIAFQLCDMVRKLIMKRTTSPVLLRQQANEHQADEENNDLLTNVNLLDVHRSTTNTSRNPCSSSSSALHSSSFHNTSKVLTMKNDIHRMSSPCPTIKPRYFIKASSLISDESEEIVNELMNIVAVEESKSQTSVKRHASFDQLSTTNDSTMNKKRYFHHKKHFLNPIPTASMNSSNDKVATMIDGHLARPHIVLNRYGDIGNYVPKFLRDNITMRSSDSNENIFFRSGNGQLINGFLKLDVLSISPLKENKQYQSTPCLNEDRNIYSLVQQIHNNHTKSFLNVCQNDSNTSDMETNRYADDHRVPYVSKSADEQQHVMKSNISPPPSKPKRVTSFPNGESELPIDYRQYLRHTDQGVHLYGGEQRQRTLTLEHTLGYLP
ncbi:unnamed protein product [Adineta ricciae]|uniref:Uncharacterized protein n=1 Tax=Adineta ricciae TaxID=249248 RepID=A0A814AWI4_ADIRI|nr:unnamed protein product [Adineta ricciae]